MVFPSVGGIPAPWLSSSAQCYYLHEIVSNSATKDPYFTNIPYTSYLTNKQIGCTFSQNEYHVSRAPKNVSPQQNRRITNQVNAEQKGTYQPYPTIHTLKFKSQSSKFLKYYSLQQDKPKNIRQVNDWCFLGPDQLYKMAPDPSSLSTICESLVILARYSK